MHSPGGVSRFFAGLFLEFLSKAFSGILAVVLLLGMVSFSHYHIFRKFRNNPLFYTLLIAALIPYILLFTHYRLPFELVMSVSSANLLAMFFSLYLPRSMVGRVVFNFIVAIIIYMLTGVPGLLVLLQVIIIQLAFSKKYLELITLLPLLLVPLLYLPFNEAFTLKQAYLGPFLVSQYSEIPLEFYFTIATPLLLLLAFSGLNFALSKRTLKAPMIFSAGGMVIVLVALVLSTNGSFEERERNAYGILQAGFNQEWDKVIQLSEQAGSVNILMQFEANRALYHSGLLLENMFHYPQGFGEQGLFLDAIFSSQVAIHTAAFYYDLKFANETRHWATEAQMVLVRHPVVLKQLIKSCIAIGYKETAMKYLRVLSGSRLYREWCDDIYLMLESNNEGEDADIKSFRSNNPDVDFYAGVKDPVLKLSNFYISNRGNNMAFEYLVAAYLLQHNLGAVVNLLPEFVNQGHEKLPKALEEALVIYLAKTGRNIYGMDDYPISERTVERFTDFSKLVEKGRNRAERMAMVSKYKNTYWYYIVFSSPYAAKK